MKCPKCSTELIWGGDNDYEDYDAEGDGIVSNNGCPNEECDVETVIIYTKIKQQIWKEHTKQSSGC